MISTTGTALIITPLVSLVTKQNNSETKGIWRHFQAGEEEEKSDAFHLATHLAVGGMIAVLAGGLLRVYSD